jgi:hypothetical protein
VRTACWAAAVVVAAIIGAFLGLTSAPASAPLTPATVAGCTAAFQAQIRYTRENGLMHPDLPVPQQCSGLTSSQVQEAAYLSAGMRG